MTTTAKIAGLSKTKDTGVTPDVTKKMWAKLGSKHMAIAELAVAERTEDTGAAKGVKLQIINIEVAGDDEAEHIRELQRAIYLARQADKSLTAGVESTPRDVVLRGQVTVLHCDNCTRSLGHERINHGRRDGVQCLWTPCRHTVSAEDGTTACPCGMPA